MSNHATNGARVLPLLGAEAEAVIHVVQRELETIRAEFHATQKKTPGKISDESKSILRFVRARLDERFAALAAANREPVVVNVTVDTAPIAEAIAEAARAVGVTVAAALQQRPKRSVEITHADGTTSRLREG